MKSKLQVLRDPRFYLVHNVTQRFSDGPNCEEIRLTRTGLTLEEHIKKKATVSKGTLVAIHPDPLMGNLYSPVHGEITDINERYVFIASRAPKADDPAVEKVSLEGLFGTELQVALKNRGVDTCYLGKPCHTLIINALNPEPGITWAEPMLSTHVRSLRAGLELQQRLSQSQRVIVALPHGTPASYEGMEVAYINPVYPNSLDPLVVAAITGKENPDDVCVVSIHSLWGLGRTLLTDGPLVETVVTLNSRKHTGNYRIKDGTRISDLLRHANVSVQPGDTVVVGGPLRGQSIALLDRGLDKHTTGVFVVEADSIPPLEGNSACINCGACVQVCPARLSPDMLSKYAEFARYDACRKEHIHACMECGLCGYVCTARRPVLQYIRLAKQKLELEERQIKLNPLA